MKIFSEKNDVLTRLGAGDFFGEIGILNIDGANRRTADVRSVGYSELFSLSKEDVLEGCRDYPEAERKLYEYAQNRLGFEKAKKEAAEKMKNAFSTLTSIASCLTQNPITTASILPLTVAKISENNSPKENNDDGKNKEVTEQAPLYRNNRKTTAGDRIKYKMNSIFVYLFILYLRLKPKIPLINVQNSICDNQEKPFLYQCPASENLSLVPSSQTRSMDLMSNIQLLINDRLVKLFFL